MKNEEKFYNRAIYTALRIGFIALLLYWSFYIIKPFIMLVIWGIIISVAVYPIHKKLAKKMGGREKLSASIITISLLLVLIVPSYLFIGSTVDSTIKFGENVKNGTFKIQPPPPDVAKWPVVGKPIFNTWELASVNLQKVVMQHKEALKDAAPKILDFATGMVGSLVMIFFSIILGGVLLLFSEPASKAGESIFETLIGKQGKNFVALSTSVIQSVVQGILGIAVVQSLLAAIGMFVVGIPAAGLWALIVLMFAIVQLPPILIMGPVAIYSFTITDTSTALIFSVYAIIVSVSDAVLKPLFLGRGVDVPMLAVLLGAIGGMITSGVMGLFVGAVVLAITYKVFEALLVHDVLDDSVEEEPVQEIKSGK